MTAKERRAMRKLEIENEELRRHFDIANSMSAEHFMALYETRRTLREVFALLKEAQDTMHRLMAADPAFMHMVGREK